MLFRNSTEKALERRHPDTVGSEFPGLGCDQDAETEGAGSPLPAATESGNYKTLETADKIEQTFNYSRRNCT